jgi:hypothetical protein
MLSCFAKNTTEDHYQVDRLPTRPPKAFTTDSARQAVRERRAAERLEKEQRDKAA